MQTYFRTYSHLSGYFEIYYFLATIYIAIVLSQRYSCARLQKGARRIYFRIMYMSLLCMLYALVSPLREQEGCESVGVGSEETMKGAL